MCLPFSVCWGECSPVHDCLVVCVHLMFRLACLYMCVCRICASVCVCVMCMCVSGGLASGTCLCICDDCVSLCGCSVFVCLPVYQVLCMCAGVSVTVCMSHAHMTLPMQCLLICVWRVCVLSPAEQ